MSTIRNVEAINRLADALQWVRQNKPNLLNMSYWGATPDMDCDREGECGTAACMAGWAGVLGGMHPTVVSGGPDHGEFTWSHVNSEELMSSNAIGTEPVAGWAMRELGLTWEERQVMFGSDCQPSYPWTTYDGALRAVAAGVSVWDCWEWKCPTSTPYRQDIHKSINHSTINPTTESARF